MVEETLLYHVVMIKLFLLMLCINLFVPLFFRSERVREIKATRITFFLYSALLAMVAFTGMVLYLIAELSWNHAMSLMVAVLVLLSGLEIARSIKLKKIWILGESGVAYSWKYVSLEIIVTVAMVILMIMEKKGAISLS
ncbi:MAG: hypothetical protein U9Q90_06715 [Campylobacterota bacterium]|nr:hypothetical protein [Campylobacterota bacterium]